MCSHLYYSEGLLAVSLLFITIWMNLPPLLHGRQPEGFLSIDCGSSVNTYRDHTTGLRWFTDVNNQYIMIGNSSTPVSVPTNLPNRRSLQQYRFFPERRNKYCYELPTPVETTYLVRAGFYLESVKELTQFIVSIDATNVFTMTYSPNTAFDPLNYVEIIVKVSGYFGMNVCLQPVAGWPFISSLELRPLNSSMYSYIGSERQYLVNFIRWNTGAPSTVSLVRFPDDLYDRFWYSLPANWTFPDFHPAIVNFSTPPDTTVRAEVNCVPPKVMQDALVGDNWTYGNSWPLFSTGPVSVAVGDYAYVAVYAEELKNDYGGVPMDVQLGNAPTSLVINVSNQASMAATSNYILEAGSIGIALYSDNYTFLTMNAMEVYGQYNFNFSITYKKDVQVINALKSSFNMTDWQGDPCTPVPHDWLSCSSADPFIPDSPTQQRGFLRSQYSVSAINLSNLPTEGFILFRNSTLEYAREIRIDRYELGSLTRLSITECGINLSIFEFLLSLVPQWNLPLTVLDVSNNAIESLPNGFYSDELTSLDLSHNLLAGPFENLNFSAAQELDLSYNAITSVPIPLLNETKNLVVLDLSCNQLVGDISSLDRVVEKNAALRELYVSNNSLSGTFSSALYFSALTNLKIANFDGNSIQGTLNLSLWLNALQEDATKNSTRMIQKLFSFVNNSISNIFPSVNAFKSTITGLKDKNPDFNKGILLGGNPYCKAAESEIQQYLCRPQEYPSKKEKNNNRGRDILIIAVSCGVLALLLCGVTIATMWKLWKQVYSLREIQKALANQQVQPPFYHYSDLKSATRDFHQDNKLGHGGFGEVYKVLNEFLNEVVLITGIKHRNLVQLKGCCIRDKQRMLIYEYVEKGNLAQALWGSKVHGGLNWEQRFSICLGVARGLSYLHEELQPSIIHRDIKPENILLDKNLKPKIADFGLARHFLEESSQAVYTKIAGTLGYFAPEYATQGQLSDKVDVYSYGIVVLEVVSGRKCIDYSVPPEKIFLKDWVHEMHRKRTLFDVLEPELRDSCVVTDVIRAIKIGLLCVQHGPQRRPSMSEVVTMFLGRMDVEVSLEESKDSESHFKDQLRTINHQMENSALQVVVEEETTDSPLLDLGFESSSSHTNSAQSSKSIIQLSSWVGR